MCYVFDSKGAFLSAVGFCVGGVLFVAVQPAWEWRAELFVGHDPAFAGRPMALGRGLQRLAIITTQNHPAMNTVQTRNRTSV